MLHPNDQAGPYTLVKFLGEGAFGQVWLEEKTTTLGTKLRVALKLLNLQLVDLDTIRQEAAVWETLKHHPHIVTLVDVEKYTVNGTEYVGIASLTFGTIETKAAFGDTDVTPGPSNRVPHSSGGGGAAALAA